MTQQYCPTCGKHNSSPKIPPPKKRREEIGRVLLLEHLNLIASEIVRSDHMYLIAIDPRDLSGVREGDSIHSVVMKVGK